MRFLLRKRKKKNCNLYTAKNSFAIIANKKLLGRIWEGICSSKNIYKNTKVATSNMKGFLMKYLTRICFSIFRITLKLKKELLEKT